MQSSFLGSACQQTCMYAVEFVEANLCQYKSVHSALVLMLDAALRRLFRILCHM